MSIQSSQVNIQMNSGKMPLSFVPEPQEIVFTDYNAGTIYKQKFCLRNLYSVCIIFHIQGLIIGRKLNLY